MQKEKKARGTAASSGDEPGRGCPSRGPDLTPAKSCRALIRMKQRSRVRLGFEKEGSIPQLPGAVAESAEERRLETSTGESGEHAKSSR